MRHTVELAAVVNINEDSFYEPSRYNSTISAVTQVNEFFDCFGVTMVDIGGESTRPNAEPISVDEEWRRIRSVINEVVPVYGEQISVDTYHPEIVHRIAKDIGRFTINDVTGGNNPKMYEAAAEHNLPYILSHLPWSAGQDIQKAHKDKEVNSVEQVVEELVLRAEKMAIYGLERSQIIMDPGIGFGKSMQLNWELLKFGREMRNNKVYIGFSNKRFLRTDPETGIIIPGLEKPSDPSKQEQRHDDEIMNNRNRLAAETAINHNVSILRVHDPRLYRDLIAA